MKRFFVGVAVLVLCFHCYGCVALLAGAAGGAGTAAWLSGKLTQEVGASPEKAVLAVKSTFEKMDLTLTKETATDDIIQIMGEYVDGKTIWVDIRPVVSGSQIAVRVGAISDKEAARAILDQILKRL